MSDGGTAADTTAMVAGGEAPDCGADADAGGIGFAGCPALRREHESGFHLAPRPAATFDYATSIESDDTAEAGDFTTPSVG